MKISRWILIRIINVYIKVVQKFKTHILCSITSFPKSCRLWHTVEKRGGARDATNNNKTLRRRVACWISKAIRARAQAATLIQATPPSNFSKTHFNIILPSRPGPSKLCPSLRFHHQNPVCTSPHTCHMPCPSQSSWFCHPNNTWCRLHY